MNVLADLSSGLSPDFENLYDTGNYTDVSISVGREPNNKIFLAHFLVLQARSTFFRSMLVDNKDVSNPIERPAMVFEDITPDVFEILLSSYFEDTPSGNTEAANGLPWSLKT
ncbi:4667_t:CDS:2 [Paraglomus occultum]|uniref:4667_t:CDS:1 n=1 Tax=Paraglomus occultum TaxID=144539 RepID=A0A9N8W4P1_9GLOM|nr:4667_t:CDS:2 [Paraglomus occultum]